MLGKLIKNSFKANASSVYNTYLAMGIIGVIMLILMLVDWTKWGDRGIGLGLAIKVAASAALCLAAFIGVILTFVSVFGEFERNMYSKEGMLTLTLPVKSSSLLFAKWLSGSFWVILSYTALCLCAFGSMLYLIRHSMGIIEDNADYSNIYYLVTEMVRQLSEAAGINAPSLKVVGNLASLYAVSGAIRACVFVLLVYFAVTLSRVRPFSKLGKIGKIIYFFAGFFIIQTISTLVSKLIKIYIVVSESAFTFTMYESDVRLAWDNGFGAFSITDVYVTAVLAAVVFLVTSILIDRKVNVNS
ncbi:MAG: hypothetical protein J1E34_02020 [Oscillospiraceae bacterium]|nr:hypothetical protein [Oscillospiraceae bacterium]